MKVEATERSGQIQRVASAYAPNSSIGGNAAGREAPDYLVGGNAAGPISQSAPVSASVLGISEAEFTPRVRDAIMTLMREVDRLRREVETARTKLADTARAADQDMLLPIFNRRAFMREISRFIAFAERYGTPSSLLYFDLDDFKSVNDKFGHAAGDDVLHHFAKVLAGQIRDTDVLARLGGDEFGVVLAHVTLDQAMRKGAGLARAVRENPAVWHGHTISLSCSYGAYELRAGENADAVMERADQAMYAQKRAAR